MNNRACDPPLAYPPDPSWDRASLLLALLLLSVDFDVVAALLSPDAEVARCPSFADDLPDLTSRLLLRRRGTRLMLRSHDCSVIELLRPTLRAARRRRGGVAAAPAATVVIMGRLLVLLGWVRIMLVLLVFLLCP